MAAPPYRIPKRPATTPQGDTATELGPPRWHMNPIAHEPHDPARCIERLESQNVAPLTPNTLCTPTTPGPAQFTPQTAQNHVGIGQRPSESDPLGIANLSPENLAILISSTVRNLNNPGGGLHTPTKPPQPTTPAGYNSTHFAQNAANNDDATMHDDPRLNWLNDEKAAQHNKVPSKPLFSRPKCTF